ncbi:glycoside hydrolase family 13 protein [Clostridiaceae bacterium]|nr:glycoside hydrolase family 13 protein [Clostridiaceae bacterium]RKI14064.1 glycoside hydrolase family 13 protein [bacterium 1XD21-70]
MNEGHNTGLNQRALFADGTSDYRRPEEPNAGDRVVLRFRTAKDDADAVFYVERERQLEARMIKVSSKGLFDFYEYVIVAGEDPRCYCFKVVKGDETCYFNRLGTAREDQAEYNFRITPGFHTPEWAKGAVMYQIFVDRFCRGNKDNDVQSCEYVYIGRPVYHVEDWGKNPSTMDVGCFYGGDLQGVWDKLDYLQDLGVEVIYFNPLFVSPSNHKYDTQDYDHIDPHYGVIVKDGGELVAEDAAGNEKATRYQVRVASMENLEASDAFFARFMEEIHKRGMRVIIDGVFNHCGSFNKWLDRELIYARQGRYEPGAYESEDSPYHTFFKFYEEGSWPYNANYDGWWGHDTLPKLNYEESPKLYEYIMEIARKWVSSPYCVDGWRLDVAADLGHSSEFNHKFWHDFREQVKKANPDAIILAEHYGDPSGWLQGDQWDSVMNYDAFMEPLTWFLTGMEKHSDEYNEHLWGDGAGFFNNMKYHMSRMQTPSLMVAMNQLSNHDHSRFLTRTNRMVGRIGTVGAEMASVGVKKGVFREAVLIQMTWPGAPTLYYGDEAGVCGWTDPDNRRTYPWGQEDYELIEFHRYMIQLHKSLPALRRGSIKQLLADRHLIAYGRMRGSNQCVVVVNNAEERRLVEVPVWELGIADGQELWRVMLTHSEGYNAGIEKYQVTDGRLVLDMPGGTGALFSVGAGSEWCR